MPYEFMDGEGSSFPWPSTLILSIIFPFWVLQIKEMIQFNLKIRWLWHGQVDMGSMKQNLLLNGVKEEGNRAVLQLVHWLLIAAVCVVSNKYSRRNTVDLHVYSAFLNMDTSCIIPKLLETFGMKDKISTLLSTSHYDSSGTFGSEWNTVD